MHRSIRVVFIAAAALGALSSAAVAGDMHGARGKCRAAREAKLLPTYDANKDGQLDRGERQRMRQDRRARALARYDADRDGQLSEAERAQKKKDRAAEKMAALDANRDGAISRQEASGPCSRLARHFDEVDQDGDGRVTQAELAAARMFGKHGRRHRHHGGESTE